MASLINSPMLDETGKAIVAAITGEEPSESAAPVSQIKAPMSEATAQALLEAIQNMNKIPAFDPTDDAGKVLTVSNSGIPVWVTPSGLLFVTEHEDGREYVLSATYNDIISANGACLRRTGEQAYLVSASVITTDITKYYVVFMRAIVSGPSATLTPIVYVSLSENDYPRRQG